MVTSRVGKDGRSGPAGKQIGNYTEEAQMTDVDDDHPLIGTWIALDEDSDAAFTFTAGTRGFLVSGFRRSDGTDFKITDVAWDGESLSFTAKFPLTGAVTKNVFRARKDGTADLELTINELWKKKAVARGEAPQAWPSLRA